jgi:hypothetical protein
MQLDMQTVCRSKSTEQCYSYLSATMGSTRIARLDGRQAASSAMARNKIETPMKKTPTIVFSPSIIVSR